MTQPQSTVDEGSLRSRASWPYAAAAMLAMAAMYWWTAAWMVARWEHPSGDYGHGYLILLVSAFFVFIKRKEIAACPARPRAWGLALVLPALALHLVGTAWRVGFLSGFSLLPLLAGLVVALFGTRMLKLVSFPLAFLVFMVPLPEILLLRLSFNMKLFAATAATHFVEALGLAAVRTGAYIEIPSGTILVDDVCSGLKYLISLTAFGALCAHISRLNGPGKMIMLLLSAPVALAANIIRVILMVLVAFAFGVEATEAWYFHDAFGLLLFVVAFVMLFVAEAALLMIPGWDRRKAPGGAVAAAENPDTAPPLSGGLARKGAMAALALAAGMSVYLAWPRQDLVTTDIVAGIPKQLGEWQGKDFPVEERVYEMLGTRDVMTRVYENDRRERVLMLIVMANQTRRRTHPPEQCILGEGYSIVNTQNRLIGVPVDNEAAGDRFEVREMLLRRGRDHLVSWYFFKSGERINTSYWRHHAGLAMRKLADPNAMDILVRIETLSPGQTPDEARDSLGRFAKALMPSALAVLP